MCLVMKTDKDVMLLSLMDLDFLMRSIYIGQEQILFGKKTFDIFKTPQGEFILSGLFQLGYEYKFEKTENGLLCKEDATTQELLTATIVNGVETILTKETILGFHVNYLPGLETFRNFVILLEELNRTYTYVLENGSGEHLTTIVGFKHKDIDIMGEDIAVRRFFIPTPDVLNMVLVKYLSLFSGVSQEVKTYQLQNIDELTKLYRKIYNKIKIIQ